MFQLEIDQHRLEGFKQLLVWYRSALPPQPMNERGKQLKFALSFPLIIVQMKELDGITDGHFVLFILWNTDKTFFQDLF